MSEKTRRNEKNEKTKHVCNLRWTSILSKLEKSIKSKFKIHLGIENHVEYEPAKGPWRGIAASDEQVCQHARHVVVWKCINVYLDHAWYLSCWFDMSWSVKIDIHVFRSCLVHVFRSCIVHVFRSWIVFKLLIYGE